MLMSHCKPGFNLPLFSDEANLEAACCSGQRDEFVCACTGVPRYKSITLSKWPFHMTVGVLKFIVSFSQYMRCLCTSVITRCIVAVKKAHFCVTII